MRPAPLTPSQHRNMTTPLLLLLAAVGVGLSDALRFTARASSSAPWVVAGRYCAHGPRAKEARLKYSVHSSLEPSPHLRLLVYTSNSLKKWQRFLHSHAVTCSGLVSRADYVIAPFQDAYERGLSTPGTAAAGFVGSAGPQPRGGHGRAAIEARDKWTFVVVSNCLAVCATPAGPCQGAVDATVDVHFTSGSSELGCDEVMVPEVYIAFAAIYGAIGGVAYSAVALLKRQRKYHHTVRLLVLSLCVKVASLAAWNAYYAIFSRTGVRHPALSDLGRLLAFLSECAMILVLVLLAKGWTVVRRKISPNGRAKIAVYASLFFCASVASLIWSAESYDEVSMVSEHETSASICLQMLRVGAACWFRYAASTTHRSFPGKRQFYNAFTPFFSFWLLHVPICVAVSMWMDEFERHTMATILILSCQTLGHGLMVALYHPNISHALFPFHAHAPRQIGHGMRKKGRRRHWSNKQNGDDDEHDDLPPAVSGGNGSTSVLQVVDDEFAAAHYARLRTLTAVVDKEVARLTEASAKLKGVLDTVSVPQTASAVPDMSHVRARAY